MRNRIIKLGLVFSVFFTLLGCAHLDRVYTIPDIEGTWEGIQFGYYFLEIREDGKGYFIYSLSAEAEDPYMITDINFLKGKFILTLVHHDEPDELLKLEGVLFGKDMLILSEFEGGLENDSKKTQESLILLRESIVPELKKSVQEKIKEIQDNNT